MKNKDEVTEVTFGWERAQLREELIRIHRTVGDLTASIAEISQRLQVLDEEEMRSVSRQPTPEEEAAQEREREYLAEAAAAGSDHDKRKPSFWPTSSNASDAPVRHVHPIGPTAGEIARANGAGELDDHDHEFPGGGWFNKGADPNTCVHCGLTFKQLQQRYGGPAVIGKPKLDPAAAVKRQLGIPEKREEPKKFVPVKGWDQVVEKVLGDESDEEMCLELLEEAEKAAPRSPFVQAMREVFDKQQCFSKGQYRALKNIAASKKGW